MKTKPVEKWDPVPQCLGEQPVTLPFRRLETMHLAEEIVTAIALARKIKNHDTLCRQIQYEGALVR